MAPTHLAGFLEDIDPAGAFVRIAALQDDRLFTQGDDLRVPDLRHVVALAGGADGVVAPRFRLDAPSLNAMVRYEVAPLNSQDAAAVEPDSPQKVVDLRDTPIILAVDELLQCELLSNPAAAQDQWLMIWFADGPIQRVTGNNMFTLRLTGSTTLVANVWTAVVPTADDNLPSGTYQIVGMRPDSLGCVAGRIIFHTANQNRPGALGVDTVLDLQHDMFRHGGMGILGEFPFTQLPTFEFLSVIADTVETVHLDLIKIG